MEELQNAITLGVGSTLRVAKEKMNRSLTAAEKEHLRKTIVRNLLVQFKDDFIAVNVKRGEATAMIEKVVEGELYEI